MKTERERKLRWVAVLLLAVVVALTLARLWLVDSLSDQGWFAKYPAIAEGFWNGTGASDRFADLSTGYLFFVAVLQGIGGIEALAVRSLQVILVSVVALICGGLAWRLWGWFAGVVATVLVLASRAALVNATELEPETLMLLVVAAGLAAVVLAEGWRGDVVAGLFFGCAILTRPTIILPLILLIAGLWVSSPSRRRILRVAGLLGSSVVVVLFGRVVMGGLYGPAELPMNPGTVFYESWNPLTSGYAGEAPAAVKDIEHALGLPDGLHVAYRLLAAYSTSASADAKSSNRYWSDRALQFIVDYPGAAARLMLRKAVLAVHSHDAWDLASMQRKDEELRKTGVWLPFGVLAGLAGLGWWLGRGRAEVVGLGLWVVGGWMVMVLFYVTSRQRNALLPAIAVLAAFAVSELVFRWRRGERMKVASLGFAAVAVGLLLSVDGAPQREDRHTWRLRFAQEKAAHEERAARLVGDERGAGEWRARGAAALTQFAKNPPNGLHEFVRLEVTTGPENARLFDLAVVLCRLGSWREAEVILRRLDDAGYRPWRGARLTSSVAYHLSRCRLASRDMDAAASLLHRAKREAPGDARVLALAAVVAEAMGDQPQATLLGEQLAQLYDPLTGDLAFAVAWGDLGRSDRQLEAAESAARALDEATSAYDSGGAGAEGPAEIAGGRIRGVV